MKVKTCVLAIILLVLHPPGFTQVVEFQTDSLSNGRLWFQLNDLQKNAYVGGIRAVVVYHMKHDKEIVEVGSNQKIKLSEHLLTFFPANNTVGEVVEQLNSFYIDSANRTTPILVGMRIVTQKFYGAPESGVRALTERARGGDYDF